MTPKLVVGGRQTGRTTELIKAAAESESDGEVCYIVCHSQDEAYRISQLAQEMGLSIGFPLTYDEFLYRSYVGQNVDKIYIDNLQFMLRHICKVKIDTVVW